VTNYHLFNDSIIMSLQLETEVAGRASTTASHETVFVDQYTNGILDPQKPMLGPVKDGGHIIMSGARLLGR
jgi:hypothetical protein